MFTYISNALQVMPLIVLPEFQPIYNIIFGCIISVVELLTAIKAYALFKKEADIRFSVLSSGFLCGGIFEVINTFYSYLYHFVDAKNLYKIMEFHYLVTSNMFIALSAFIAVFWSAKLITSNTKKTASLIFSIVLISALFVFAAFQSFTLIPINILEDYSTKLSVLNPITNILSNSIFLITAFVFIDNRRFLKKPALTLFSIGLLVMTFTQIFVFSGSYLTSFYRFYVHIGKIAGLLLLFAGIKDIETESRFLSFKTKLSVIPSLYLLLTYFIFITGSSILFNINFPIYINYLIFGFFIFSIILQYTISSSLVNPLKSLIRKIGSFHPEEKPIIEHKVSNDEVGLLTNKINEFAEADWKHFQGLKISNNRERVLKEIIEATMEEMGLENLMDYVCQKVADTFGAQRVSIVRLSISEWDSYWALKGEYLANKNIKGIKDTKIDSNFIRFWRIQLEQCIQPIAIDDIEKAHIPDFVSKIYKEIGTKSLMLTPIKKGSDLWGPIVVSVNDIRKVWTPEEKSLLSSIADQLYIAVKQTELYEINRHQSEQNSAVKRIIDAIGTNLDLKQMLQVICKETLELFQVNTVAIGETSSKNAYSSWDIVVTAQSNESDSELKEMSPEFVHYLGKTILEGNKDLVIDNIDAPEVNELYKKYHKEIGTKSIINVPIRRNSDAWGIIALIQCDKYRHWTDNEKELLHTIAGQAYVAAKQAELYETAKTLAEREALLRKITNVIRKSLDINDVLVNICDEIAKVFGVQRATIIEFPDKNDFHNWVVRREFKIHPEIKGILENPEFNVRIGEVWAKSLFEGNGVMPIDNIPQSDLPEFAKELYADMGPKSILITPIQSYEDKWGVIILAEYEKHRHWTENDIALIQSIADQVYLGIKQAELYSATKKQAERELMVRTITNTIRTTLDIDKTLQVITQEVASLFKADRVILARFPDMENLKSWFIQTDYTKMPQSEPYDTYNLDPTAGEYWGELLFKQDKALCLNDVAAAQIPESLKNNLKALGIKAITGIAIKNKEEIWGSLTVASNTYREWSQDELDLLATISDQIFLAIRQSELFSEIKSLANRENLLRTIINEVLAAENLDNAIIAFAAEVSKIFDVDRISIRIYDPVSRSFSENFGQYKKPQTPGNILPFSDDLSSNSVLASTELDEFLIKNILEKDEIFILDDIDDERLSDTIKNIWQTINVKSTVISPIKYKNEALGLLFLTNTEFGKPAGKINLNLLSSIVQQVAIGINLFQLTDKLEKSLEGERVIREVLAESRKQEDHDKIFTYLLKRLLVLFNVEIGIHMHIDEDNNVTITNGESILEEPFNITKGPISLEFDHLKEIIPSETGEPLIINNTDTEIKDPQLKEFLKQNNIKSLISHYVERIMTGETAEDLKAITLLCATIPRQWKYNEISGFRLATDTVSLIYFEALQRKEAENLKNTFIATLTHDLRSPINAEQKALEYILSRPPDSHLGSFSEFLTSMYKTNDELLRIVNNILTVYHYESGKFELALNPAYIQEIITNAVNSMRPLAQDEESDITANIDPNLPEILIDKGEINRVVTNLISNAIKHTKKGTTIHVSAQKANDEIIVSVKDNGQGIPEEDQQKIFQRYPTKKRKIGTGLGLYLSKQIIDAHAGRIWFESQIDRGTTFYFALKI